MGEGAKFDGAKSLLVINTQLWCVNKAGILDVVY